MAGDFQYIEQEGGRYFNIYPASIKKADAKLALASAFTI